MQKLTREKIKSVYDLGPDAIIDLFEQLMKANEMLVQQVSDLKTRIRK